MKTKPIKTVKIVACQLSISMEVFNDEKVKELTKSDLL